MAEEEVGVFANAVKLVVPQPCYDEFFVKFNLLHVACLKMVLSKCLGYSIIAGSVLVKLPQIAKILSAKSGEGINMLSVTLEVIAITATMAYSYSQGFPLSAYGDAFFLLLQTVAIAFLVMYYMGNSLGAVLYTAVVAGIVSFLMSPMVSKTLLWYLQASVLPIVVSARMIQAVTNYRNQSTGQLSLVTFLLLFLGSMARIFTSVQETGDSTVIIIYCTSTTCNFFILSQILYYGGSKKVKTQ